ncbi:MAG: molybdopterin-synthase adenylyltransferase MoeB [Gammaproteobacteria bacterium]|nr:molybdopterin-synthase adenylyltransferase MoeB [Gammaproteobacteria bacterium]MCP5200443.1 molybdopterin-synthase adenylyltransferase MoeB [Gammaproteobacteria bacterium]
MDDQLLLRYSRQILLPEIDIDGQARLADASVLLVGLGGLGSPVSMYLAAAGVGRLVLVDDDTVELSNLQRQIVHGTADLGRPKVESARDRLAALNPSVTIEPIATRLEDADFERLLPGVDAVVDATDNFQTRFRINHHCVRQRKPLISGAAIRFEGQVSVFHAGTGDSPCYRCLYGSEAAVDATCSTNGVVAPLLGIIGSVQAMETLKVLLGIGEDLAGRLLLLDALLMEWQTMRLRKNPRCPECGTPAA